MSDDMITCAYGPVNDAKDFEKWTRTLKDSHIQSWQTSMINLQGGWFKEFVRGETDFDDTLALIHNLAREYRLFTLVPHKETPNQPVARGLASANFYGEYQALQTRAVNATEEEKTAVVNKTRPPRALARASTSLSRDADD